MNALELRRRTLGKGVYKKTVEGNPAIAQGSLARRYPGITMQGWTEQDGTPTPEAPVPIVSAGTQNRDAGKYQYEVKLTGKNLFDAEYFRTTLDWKPPADENGYPYIPIYIGKGKKITISTDGTPAEGLDFYCTIARTNKNTSSNVYTWIYHSNIANLIKTNVSFGVIEDDYIYFALNSGHSNVEKFLNAFTNFQIEISAQRTEYQPYKEQTVILTSDRPLTKWDKLEKRNGQWGWVYKSAEIESYTDESVPGEYYSTTGQLSVGAQVWYETATKTFVPLSPEEQKQMNALHTFRPTTVLSNDCGCNMTLTYKTKESMQSASGGGILKADGVTSEFIFPVKWNQVNKIVLKISGISSNQSIFVCGEGAREPWIGLNNDGVMSMIGLKKAEYSGAPENEIVDGKYHEMIFTFEKSVKHINISNIWDSVWSKNIIYHEIMFYDDDELLSDCVPYYKGAGYMLDKKNNIVIRASDPYAYQFA